MTTGGGVRGSASSVALDGLAGAGLGPQSNLLSWADRAFGPGLTTITKGKGQHHTVYQHSTSGLPPYEAPVMVAEKGVLFSPPSTAAEHSSLCAGPKFVKCTMLGFYTQWRAICQAPCSSPFHLGLVMTKCTIVSSHDKSAKVS